MFVNRDIPYVGYEVEESSMEEFLKAIEKQKQTKPVDEALRLKRLEKKFADAVKYSR